MNEKKINCANCRKELTGEIFHIGFSSAFPLYNTENETCLVISLSEVNISDLEPPSRLPQGDWEMWKLPYLEKIENLFESPPEGGRFKYLAPPRCPNCKKEIFEDYYGGKISNKETESYGFIFGKSYRAKDLIKTDQRNRIYFGK